MGHGGKSRICFVAHNAYGAVAGGSRGSIGGVERQTSLMADWFVGRGYEVSVLTWDEGGPAEEMIEGVRVIKICRQDAGIKGVRFLWPRWARLVAALSCADAGVYYHNLAECVTGQTAFWCRNNGRKFVFSAAADSHCALELPYIRTFRDRALYRYGLRNADKVIVQSRRQQQMMRENFGCDSAVLPMPCPGPSDDDYRDCELNRGDSQRILWIGRLYELKRPDWLLDLAERCPDLNFDLVGPAVDSEYASGICQRAKSLSNVVCHGRVPRARMPELYRRAKIVCCTSKSEGFPNTFLEAWSYGLPIVSTFDPDNLIVEKGLGRVGADTSQLEDGVRELLNSPGAWQKASRCARQYYMSTHTIEAAMPRFEGVFLEVLA